MIITAIIIIITFIVVIIIIFIIIIIVCIMYEYLQYCVIVQSTILRNPSYLMIFYSKSLRFLLFTEIINTAFSSFY